MLRSSENSGVTDRPSPPAEVQSFYDEYSEESRLQTASFQLEYERTKDILQRYLPPAPGPVVDVGGAAGAYSGWLAGHGYDMHLVDAAPRLIDEARKHNATLSKPIATITLADARALPQADGFAAAVLVMGPLYHLQSAVDRQQALREARRVLVAGGTIVAAGISRFASALDGIVHKFAADPAFRRIRDRDLFDGCHVNDTGRIHYFTTAYFHHPDELETELRAAGFGDVELLGVEGPGWLMPDFDARWADPALRADMLDVARKLESERTLIGASAHLISVGRK
jgi:ubiquinone/menaquinone biosynthesis C-methylase UbiE